MNKPKKLKCKSCGAKKFHVMQGFNFPYPVCSKCETRPLPPHPSEMTEMNKVPRGDIEGFFESLGIKLLSGSEFREQMNEPCSCFDCTLAGMMST